MSSSQQQKEQARRVREEHEAADLAAAARVRRLRMLGIALAVSVAVVIIAIIVSSGGNGSPEPKPGEAVAGQAAAAEEFAGIPQNGPSLGDPSAKTVLIEYADLVCPACKAYSDEIIPSIVRDYVRTGKVRMEMRAFGYVRPYSLQAARYAWAAAEQDKLWPFAKIWYTNQLDENRNYVTDAFARRIASGVPGLDAERLLRDARSAKVTAEIDATARAFDLANGQGTPAFTIGPAGGKQKLVDLGGSTDTAAAAIDKAIAGG
jgi:protein-disulfide isomerase